MKINTLELTNVRGFTHAKLEFQPGFNLIVGINGVGKTTVLESLRVVFSNLLPEATLSRNKKESFNLFDIQIGKNNLQLNAAVNLDKESFSFVMSKQKEKTKLFDTENIRAQTYDVADLVELKPKVPESYKKALDQPLVVYYSANRSLMNEEKPTQSQTVGGQAVAFAEALNPKREFTIRLFAEWFHVQDELAKEDAGLLHKVKCIKKAIYTFLSEFSELKVIKDIKNENKTFSIVKGNKELSFQQLSDGERSMLALVFDIARRLTIANTTLENPLEGEAVILIDELDLHLHPKWQRTIVSDLQRTFPNCQFIATTHSPQIIGEVKPDSITIIDKDYEKEVYKPNVAFGLDSQRVLEELLEAPIRNVDINTMLVNLSRSVDDEKFADAKKIVSELKKILGEHDPELIRINSMIQFLEEDLEDEKDS